MGATHNLWCAVDVCCVRSLHIWQYSTFMAQYVLYVWRRERVLRALPSALLSVEPVSYMYRKDMPWNDPPILATTAVRECPNIRTLLYTPSACVHACLLGQLCTPCRSL